MQIVHKGIKEVVWQAYKNRRDGSLYWGKKESEPIQRDSRLPHVFCKDLTRLRFVPKDKSRELWILNYASHTESLLGDDICSADFATYVRNAIYRDAGADCIYFIGAIGGLIRLKELDPDNIKSTIIGGESLARTACAIKDEKKLTPVINLIRQEYYSPAENYLLAALCGLNIVRSERYAAQNSDLLMAIKTEMTYIEIGELNMLLLPCELFPELAYGGYLSAEESAQGLPPEVNPLPLVDIAQDKELLVFGVTNDFTGYVVPPNDFMLNPTRPYIDRARDRLGRGHYEETNSLGPKTAGVIAQTFEGIIKTVREAKQ